MFNVILNPIQPSEQDQIAEWAKTAEAQKLLSAARANRAEAVAKCAEVALSDSIRLIGGKGELPLDAVEAIARAARYTIFLEVWHELTHQETLNSARVEIA